MQQPEISVGIVNAQSIRFSLNANYSAKGSTVVGDQVVSFSEGGICWNGALYQELMFAPMEAGASFSICDVTIGINFHWERQETQVFSGALKLVVEEGKITAINLLPVEEYLVSVISSEMKATSSLESLKAHAVISRSWLFAQMEKRKHLEAKGQSNGFFSFIKNENEFVRWYDREDHTIFDVCADDHCQRYQGITKATNQWVDEAVRSTCGQVLTYDGEICDTRFAKCCGGITEVFDSCWEDKHYPYLSSVRCACGEHGDKLPDLRVEAEAVRWIRSSPMAFCNTSDKRVLAQILNHYDQETTDFYRWEVRYTRQELSELVCRRSKIDFGEIVDLVPIQRGTSGRIIRLKIVGTRCTLVVGKELEIRRILSESHLFSSAFVVEKQGVDKQGLPAAFVLTGAGWGHGVGLCQIGAAVMGEQGYRYDEILLHYYRGATIERKY
ncbi:MAG: SpoIID/LytB domain-containing protein [Bacteroidaceae bacterium]|nr:SpoIID/LytB domain-containing protein [Bacteroidaceae bacterium]